MCLTVPARVIRVTGSVAWIDDEGGERPISLAAIGDVRPGEYVLHHAGLALDRIKTEEAVEILALLADMSAENDREPGARP